MPGITRAGVTTWLEGYERAWRSTGTAALRELFSQDATYQLSPYDQPVLGLDAIATMWERERAGPDEQFTLSCEIVAVEADIAVVYAQVLYAGPPPRPYRDLWVLRFDQAGRCGAFQEWPFWPDQPRAARD